MNAPIRLIPCPWCRHRNPPHVMECEACDQPTRAAPIGVARQFHERAPDPERMEIRIYTVVVVLLFVAVMVAAYAWGAP